MKMSAKGIRALALEEALVLVAYQDGEHMSWGFGHNDPALKPGDTTTIERALALLAEDLTPREDIVARMIKVPMAEHENDALVSAYYNKGNKLVPVARLINVGERNEAMAALLTINRNDAGEFKPGLAERRMREMRMFLRGDYGDLSKKIKFYCGDPKTTQPEEMDFPNVI